MLEHEDEQCRTSYQREYDRTQERLVQLEEENFELCKSIDENSIESFAGMRVLPRSEKNAFARPREVLFAVDNETCPRVLSVMGGKLTTYRATAQMALERLKPSLPVKEEIANTSQLPLTPVS